MLDHIEQTLELLTQLQGIPSISWRFACRLATYVEKHWPFLGLIVPESIIRKVPLFVDPLIIIVEMVDSAKNSVGFEVCEKEVLVCMGYRENGYE